MAASKLRLYQDVARLLADARLATITDDVESRRALDDSFDEAVDFCMRQAAWRFALTTITLSTGGVPINGYTYNYIIPTISLRIHRIYLLLGTRQYPVDLRQTSVGISCNAANLAIQYVNSAYADPDVTPWPEHFSQVVAAYLAFLVAERVTGERGAAGRMSQLFNQLLGEAVRVEAEPDDRWLPYQRNGALLIGARDLLCRASWRFALGDAVIVTQSGTAAGGFAHSFPMPSDWLRTHRLFIGTTRETPFDVREQGDFWSANVASFKARYVSETALHDPTRWPEPFYAALLAYLDAGMPKESPAQQGQQQQGPEWQQAIALAISVAAEPDDEWLPFQLNGQFANAVPAVMSRGYWWWTLVERQYSAEADQLQTQPAGGFPYRYALPTDWFKTHALFVPWDGGDCPVNIRQTAADWSTDAENLTARYVSTAALDPELWPQSVEDAVYAWLAWRSAPPEKARERQVEFDRLMAEALAMWSRPEDDWLRFQLNGSYQQTVKQLLEEGRWRFAIRSPVLTETSDPLPAELSDGTAVAGYAYRFIQPNDLLRTVRIDYQNGTGPYSERCAIDFVDEGDSYHTNYTPITVRYVSRLGLDSTKWPAHFRNAALAWLQYQEVRADPAKANIAVAKLQLYKDACREAEYLDDARDRPHIIRPGKFIRARRGGQFRYPDRSFIRLDTTVSSDSGETILTNEGGDALTNG